jgi:hypothetical protein
MMTSCCKRWNNKSLTEKQFNELVETIPDYPRLHNFNIEEKKRIASIPPLFKEYNLKIIKITKCLKENKCEQS